MDVKSFVEAYRPKIDDQIKKEMSLHENGDRIAKVMEGGKRLRPLVCILVYKLAGGKDDARATSVAVSIELAHAASLLKDEIIDQDTERRGRVALWKESGPTVAMSTADSMIQIAVRGMASAGKDLLDTFMGGWETAWKGQEREASVLGNLRKIQSPTLQGYYAYIGEKTGSLFAAAAKLGAQAAGASQSVVDSAYNFGYQLGILYQLADDYVDITKGKSEAFPFLAVAQIEEQVKGFLLDGLVKQKFSPLEVFAKAGIDTPRFYQEKISDAKVRVQSLFSVLPVDKEYSAVAASLGDYVVDQMMKELETPAPVAVPVPPATVKEPEEKTEKQPIPTSSP